MYDIFKSIELDAAWLPALSEHAAGCGIAFAASAFDLPSLAALEGVAVPFHKVASSETTNLRLVGAMAATRSEEQTSELQSLMRISYAVFCMTTNTSKS